MDRKKAVWVFFLWLAVILLGFNAYISLWDQDEAAYAGFARRMLETGNYLIPDFDWSFIHRKPPFHFWSIALAYKIFGINEFAVRFFPSLAVWLSVFLLYYKGKKLLDEQTAFRAAVIMGTSVFIVMLGKMAVTDAWMLLFYTLAGLSLREYLKYGNKKSLAIFYVAFALALLVKGPPMLVFGGMLFLLLLVFWPGKKAVIQTHPWFFGLLALLPFAVWLFLSYNRNPDFVRWWTDWYILKRLHGSVLGQTGPPGTYLLLFILFFLPFLPFLLRAFGLMFRKQKSADLRYFTLWFMAGWLIYELLPSKLPAYVLAAYPPLAFLMSMAMKEMEELKFLKTFRFGFWLQMFISGILLVAGIIFAFLPHSKSFRLPLFVLIYLLLFFFVLTFSAYRNYIRKNPARSLYFLFLNALFWITGLFMVLLPLAEPFKNATRQTAVLIKEKAPPQTPVVVMNDFGKPPSLIFYLETKNPDKEIILGNTRHAKKYLQENFARKKAVWILAPDQTRFLPYPGKDYEIYRINALNTGKAGKNDYIILIPR